MAGKSVSPRRRRVTEVVEPARTGSWRGVGIVSVAIGVGTLVVLTVLVWPDQRNTAGQDSSAPRSQPAGAPPLDPVQFLHLPAEHPDSVAQLKAEALAVTDRLVESFPHDPQAYAQRALLLTESGAGEQARVAWQQALECDPSFGAAYLGLGVLAAERAEFNEAQSLLQQAIEQDPDAPHAYRELVQVYLRNGQADDAAAVAQQFAQRFPGLANSHFWLGQALLQQGQWAAARDSHQRAARIDPDWSQPYGSLAQACARLGDRQAVVEYRQKFAELKRQEGELDQQRTREYDDLAAQQRVTAKIHNAAGQLYFQQLDVPRAEAHWLRAASLSPDDKRSRQALERLYDSQQRLAARAQMLHELARLERTNPQWEIDACRCLAAMGRWTEAQPELLRVVREHPQAAEAHTLLAQSYLSTGHQLELATQHAQKAVELSPDAQAYLVLAAALRQQGQRHAAQEILARALVKNPHDTQLLQAYEQVRHGE